ncbi:YicC/YloC family endoribonuclease [Thalassoglobus sp.]|uniref:YicC/YloC family endoribonuclease n=1 Tax=Thalassoglobus sp. TaxID=2795869 RepID=UPI003AA8C63C
MLLSMTGHGDASGQNERVSVTAEIRSVNNRHLKVSVRCQDAFLALESNIERLIRKNVARGTLTVSLRVRQLADQRAATIDQLAVQQYWTQLKDIAAELNTDPPKDLSPLLSLPGILKDNYDKSVDEGDWPLFEEVILAALKRFQDFRIQEGESMGDELNSLSSKIEENLDEIEKIAPQVIVDYRDRLKNRVNELLQSTSVKVDDNDLLRETSLFADRCDITEEVTRLRSHLQQYRTLLDGNEAAGRKLEFLGQEMFREVNTIGSKANHIEIAHRVVDMKAAIEKMREMIQNIE